MLQTEQSVIIGCDIERCWDFARDVEGWAALMPGYVSSTMETADDSQWVLKVGVGAFLRTVRLGVHVERWAGPACAEFSFRLIGDPVEGSGSYRAEACDSGATRVTLALTVAGSGPLAPMWEAMGGPVLPRLARGFAEELKARIEALAAAQAGMVTPPPPPRPGLLARLRALLARICTPAAG